MNIAASVAGGSLPSPSRLASLKWFAQHELRLAWRDWAQLMSGGRRLQDHAIVFGMAAFAVGLHVLAYVLLEPILASRAPLDVSALLILSAALLLTFTMMLSQAMESVTRAFYSRDDLDLLLSSPASSQDLFTVRIALMALTTACMSGLMVAPFLNVAAWLGGAQWLGGYLVLVALSAVSTGAAVLIALWLFRWVGAKKTRLVAQIAAAVVGASFLIGLQVVAIVSYGSMSRWSVLNSDTMKTYMPGADSFLWMPALATSGQPLSLLAVLAVSAAFFAFATATGAKDFRRIVISALSVPSDDRHQTSARRTFQSRSTLGALVHKEWTLLQRDPWLMSQTLMQVLYLIPPALMLYVNFGAETEISAILAPVIVMAIGQLAGGLAWLTISGEDAPDLVATAPVRPFALIGAKVLAVLMIVTALVIPLALAIALISLWGALATFAGALLAAASAILIQLWFRAQAKRSNFRRRQVASKASTFCEAFASISCAGTAALVAAGNPIAVVPAFFLAIVMAIAWGISPRRA